jgi:acetyl esterase
VDWFSVEGTGGALDAKVRAMLDAQGPVAEFRSQPVALTRKNFDEGAAKLPKLKEPLAKTEDRTLPEGLKLRIYSPDAAGPLPILLFFHGGGWVLGDLESHDDLCRSLARRSGVRVVAVDYRRSPETKYPGPLDDAEAALRWAAGESPRVAVGGDSAGGNLAAALALRTRDRGGPKIAFQLLIYPVTDTSFDRGSYRDFASGVGLTRSNMQWFWDSYLRDAADAADPYAAPLKAPSLKGLPPAYVLSAEFDVLRDEVEAYARRLHKEGVPVRGVRYNGMNHGFIRMGALYPQADRALTELASQLRAALQ